MSLPERVTERVALFDVCKTLVDITTITDFTEHFLLSREHHSELKVRTRVAHAAYKMRRAVGAVSRDGYVPHAVSLLKGYREEDVAKVAHAYVQERLAKRIKAPVFKMLKELEGQGYRVYLVSAGIDVYLKPFATFLGVGCISTVAEIEGGVYTGRIMGSECRDEGKVYAVRAELPDFDAVNWEESFAFGDSVADIPLLSIVGRPCAIDPSADLASHACEHGWDIQITMNR